MYKMRWFFPDAFSLVYPRDTTENDSVKYTQSPFKLFTERSPYLPVNWDQHGFVKKTNCQANPVNFLNSVIDNEKAIFKMYLVSGQNTALDSDQKANF